MSMICHVTTNTILERRTIMFEELLNKITKMEAIMALLLDLYMQQTNSLTTYKDVAKLLGVTTKTVNNYIRASKLIRDKHYYINAQGKTVFIPQAIMEFKQSVYQIQNTESKDTIGSRVMHPIASKVLQGVA